MIIEFKSESPLYKAFKENEEALSLAIKIAAQQSAILMGKGFNEVYHRSYQINVESIKKVA